jgi:putative ABC transport system permease protein
MNHPPPRAASRLLRALLPDELGEEALDDLADQYDLHSTRSGRATADRWYWRQVPVFALRLRLATVLGGSLASPGPRRAAAYPEENAMHSTLTDLRYGARGIARSPGFTAIAVVTIALGIGATAAIFSVVRSVLLRPLPFPEPDRIVQLSETRADRDMFDISFTYANFWDVHDMNRTLDAVGAIRWRSMNLTGAAEPLRLRVAGVTEGFFRALRVTPMAGRLFARGEDAPGTDARIAILGHTFWTTRFGADRTVIGRPLTLDGQPFQIVGVLPRGTPWLDAAEVFIPFVRPARLDRDSWELPVVGRLARGVTPAAAQADLDRIARHLAATYPEAKGLGIRVQSSERWVASDTLRRALWVLVGAVGLLLLIACVNLANMLLARATTRGRERAMRAALGASRSRVVQLALTESLLLSALGAAAGLALAFGAVRVFRTLNPGDIPRLADAGIDGWVVLVALGTAVFTTIITGLVPALRTPYHDVVTALRESERSVAGHRKGSRLRHALVAVEVALSLVLLVGAGLLVRSFGRVLGVERGFHSENRAMFSVGFPSSRTEAESNRSSQRLTDVLARLRSRPEITSAAVVHMRPLAGTGTGMGFGAVDRPDATGKEIPWAGWRVVSNDYFKTMGLPLIAGRDFTEQDRIGEPWRVIISRRIAVLLWPGQDAVGRRLVLWKGQGTSEGEVIGVVGDMRDWELTEDPTYSVYFPTYGYAMSPANFVVHTRLSTGALVPLVRSMLAEVDPTLPIADVQTLDALVGDSVASRRFTMTLLAALAVTALVLALAGIYGVLSYAVSQRRSEMGVRMALGASKGSVLRLVMLQGMRPVVIGLVVGVAGAVALSRFMTSLLFGVTPSDWPTYAGVALLLLVAAALSCFVPARDALRVDVTAALREE